MSSAALEMRIRVLMSLQRALLGMVTPSLRGVAVAWETHRITGRFIYDPEALNEGHEDIVREIETEVLADFDDDVAVDFNIEAAANAAPPALLEGEVWVYLRRGH